MKSYKKIILLGVTVFLSIASIAQLPTQLLDDFNRADNAVVGGGWTETNEVDGPISISTNMLFFDDQATDNTPSFASQNISTLYNPIFGFNSDTITWEFNMRQTRASPSGSNSVFFILGGTVADFNTGVGYAVRLGSSGDDEVELIRYNAGLSSTNVITHDTTNLDVGFKTIRVRFIPNTNEWILATHNNAAAFDAPGSAAALAGYAANPIVSAVNSTYSDQSLPFLGVAYEGKTTGATDMAFFDNINIPDNPCTQANTKNFVHINEIHYDNTTDGFNEGVEIAGPDSSDLSCYSLHFYSDATTSVTQALTGKIGGNHNSWGTKWFNQAGMTDATGAIALEWNGTCGGTAHITQLLSYEGTITPTAGPANGFGISTDILVSESGASAADQTLQLSGTGNQYSQFTWQAQASASRDTSNNNQTFKHSIFINEIHATNDGGDVNEGVEILSPTAEDLTCYKIERYDPTGGVPGFDTLKTGRIISISDNSNNNACNTNRFNFVSVPDLANSTGGVALVYYGDNCNCTGGIQVVQFLEYGDPNEKVYAKDGIAKGMVASNTGGADQNPDFGLDTTMQLVGAGGYYEDFLWSTGLAVTRDSSNVFQGLDGCISNGGCVEIAGLVVDACHAQDSMEIIALNVGGAAVDIVGQGEVFYRELSSPPKISENIVTASAATLTAINTTYSLSAPAEVKSTNSAPANSKVLIFSGLQADFNVNDYDFSNVTDYGSDVYIYFNEGAFGNFSNGSGGASDSISRQVGFKIGSTCIDFAWYYPYLLNGSGGGDGVGFYPDGTIASYDNDGCVPPLFIGNNPPVANRDTVQACENQTITYNVVANDIDTVPNPDTLTVAIITPPNVANGVAIVSGDSSIQFTPVGGFNGRDSVIYSVCDNGMSGVVRSMCDTTTLVIEMNPLPVDSFKLTDPSICFRESIQIQQNGAQIAPTAPFVYTTAYTYQLKLKADSSNVTGGLDTATATTAFNFIAVKPATTTKYIVQVTDTLKGCATYLLDSAVVTVNPLPDTTLTVTGSTICLGETGTFTINATIAGTEYTLKDSLTNALVSIDTSTAGGALVFNLAPLDTTIYYVIARSIATGCSDTLAAMDSIVVKPLPDSTLAVSDATVCLGNAATITLTNATNGVTYDMFRNGDNKLMVNTTGLGADLPFVINFDSLTIDTTQFYIRATVNGCSSTLDDTASVFKSYADTTLAVSDDTVCVGAGSTSIVLSNSQTGITYQLQKAGVDEGASQAGDGTNLTFNPAVPGVTTKYTIEATVTASSCISILDDTATVKIDTLPTNNFTVSDPTICLEDTAIFNVSNSVVGTSYILTSPTAVNLDTIAGTGAAFDFKHLPSLITEAGTYTVTAYFPTTTTNCSQLFTDNGILTINALPDTSITPAFTTKTICLGDSVVFNAVSAANTNYDWMDGAGVILSGATDSLKLDTVKAYSIKVALRNTVTSCVDTSRTITLTIATSPDTTLTPNGTLTICDGDSVELQAAKGLFSYDWKIGGASTGTTTDSIFAKTAGIYHATVAASATCVDSTRKVSLVVNPIPTTNQTLDSCLVAIINGNTYTADSVINDTLAGAASTGCDSIVITTLTINPRVTFAQSLDSCVSATINGNVYTADSVIRDTLLNAAVTGCDSIVVTTLTIKTGVTFAQTLDSCVSAIINGNTYTADSVIRDTLAGAAATGCDSIVVTTLTITPLPSPNITFPGTNSMCSGDSIELTATPSTGVTYQWKTLPGNVVIVGATSDSIFVKTARTYYVVVSAGASCTDSTGGLGIIVNPMDSSTQIIDSCLTATINGTVYTSSQTIRDTLVGAASSGCDSLVVTTLTIKLRATSSQTLDSCGSATINGTTYLASNPAISDTLIGLAANGCDSIVNTNLTINSEAITAQALDSCLTATINGTTYTSSQLVRDTIVGGAATGCDSIINTTLTINTVPTNTQTLDSCLTATINGTVYTTSQTIRDTLIGFSAQGCDSIVVTNLTIKDRVTGTQTLDSCSTAIINGNTYTTSQTIRDTLPNAAANGCDSIVVTNLTINSASVSVALALDSCRSATINGTVYTSSQIVNDTLVGAASTGCDSIIQVNLTIKNQAVFVQTLDSCLTATINGNTYSTIGSFLIKDTIVGSGTNGCDSLVHTFLTISDRATFNQSITACETVTINGTAYTSSQTVRDTLVGASAAGCDSIVVTTLTINNNATSTTNLDSCTSATIGGVTYTASQVLTNTLVGGAANGCDSIITINLTINNSATSTQNLDSCVSAVINGTTYFASQTFSDTLVAAAANGCDSIVTTNLTITPLPNTALAVTGSDICGGQTGTFTIIGANSNTEYTLHNNGTNAIEAIDTSVFGGNLIFNVTPVTTTIYYVLARTIGSACSDTLVNKDTINVIPNPIHTITLLSASSNFCTNDSAFLLAGAVPVTAVTYQWKDNGVVIPGATDDSLLVKTPGKYYYVASFGGSCQDSSGILNITSTNIPITTINLDSCFQATINGKVYTTSQKVDSIFIGGAASGCDSIVSYNLTITKPVSTDSIFVCSPITINGKLYAASQTIVDTLIGAGSNGCDSIATTILSIDPANTVSFNQLLTACGSATINGNVYTSSQVVRDTLLLASSTGCDSIVNTALTINNQPVTTLLLDSCGSATINGTLYTASIVIADTIIGGAASGCDSIINTNLTISNEVNTAQTLDSCLTALINGKVYTSSQTISDTIFGGTSTGCDSIITTTLTINSAASSSQAITTCVSETINGTVYFASQTVIDTLVAAAANGCDSIVTTILTITPSVSSTQTLDSCLTATIHGNTYTLPGGHLINDTLIGAAAKGCDSIVITRLTIKGPATSTQLIDSCGSATYKGTIYTASTLVRDTIIGGAASGCDSIIEVTINILTPASSAQTLDSCLTATINGTVYTGSQIIVDTLIGGAASGCDSIVTTTLTINPIATSTQTLDSCLTATINGTVYSASKVIIDTLVGAAATGCDSIVTTNLTINANAAFSQTLDSCLTATVNGKVYTASATITDTIIGGAATGCDSIVTSNLTINGPAVLTQTLDSCLSAIIGGVTFTADTIIRDTIIGGAASGCDSIIAIDLTINSPATSSQTAQGCGTLTVNGTPYTTSQTVIDTLIAGAASGCDSIVTTVVTIDTVATTTIDVDSCLQATVGGIVYTISQTLPPQTLVGANGCDSVVTTNITIHKPVTSSTNVDSCLTATINGKVYTTSQIIIDTLIGASSFGCDSIVITSLTIKGPITATQNIDSCLTATINGKVYTSSQVITDTIANAASNGCDSIITTNLTINGVVTGKVTLDSCLIAVINGKTYTTSFLFRDTLIGGAVTGCDSITETTLNILDRVTATQTLDSCLTATINGKVYTSSTTIRDTLLGAATTTCDSIIITNLTINGPTTFAQSIDSCLTATVNGKVYTTSQVITDTLIGANSNRCDSIVTTTLTIKTPATSTQSLDSCLQAIINGSTYLTSQSVIDTLVGMANNGCDSIVTTNLTIKGGRKTTNLDSCLTAFVNGVTFVTDTALRDTIIGGSADGCDSITEIIITIKDRITGTQALDSCLIATISGTIYTSSQTINDTLIGLASNGCDSIVVTTLTITKDITTTQTLDSCLIATINGKLYTTSQTIRDTLLGVGSNGCDSIVVTTLTIKDRVTTTQTLDSCLSATINGTVYASTQTIRDTLLGVAANSCDSIVVTNLTINNRVTTTQNLDSCVQATINGKVYTSSQTIRDTLVGAAATTCDSIVVTTLTINSLPTAGIASSDGDNSICKGDNVTFAGSGGTTYEFFLDGVSQGAASATTTFATTTLTTGQKVNVIVTDANNCVATSNDITTIVNNLPTPGLTSSDTDNTICAGDNVTFTATGGSFYEFYVSGVSQGAISTKATFSTTTLTNLQNTNVDVVDANGCVATHIGIITIVNDVPTATLTSSDADNTICAGENVTFTATGGTTYQFFIDGVSQGGVSTVNTLSTSNLTNGQIVTANVISANKCEVISTGITTTVNSLPIVTLTSSDLDNKICGGDNVIFTATGGASYEFFIDGVSQGVPSATSTFVSTTISNGQVVTVEATNSSTCKTLSTGITTTVTSVPATTISNSSIANTICSGESVTFTATGATTYEFFVDGISQAPASATNSFVTTSLTTGQIVKVTGSNSSCDSSASNTITVTQGPEISLALGDGDICLGETAIINLASSEIGVTYQLRLDAGNAKVGTAKSGTGGLLSFNVSPATTTTYNILASSGKCDVVLTDKATVKVHGVPLANLTSSDTDNSICKGESVLFKASGGILYEFYVNNVLKQNSSNADLFSYSALNSGDVVYAKVTSIGACTANTNSIITTVNNTEDATFNYNSTTLCSDGADAFVSVNTPGGVFTTNTPGLTLTTSGTISPASSTVGTYVIEHTTSGKCPNKSSGTITISDGAFNSTFNYNQAYCTNDTAKPVFIGTGSAGAFSANPTGLTFANVNSGYIDLANSKQGSYIITNTIPASGGCVGSTSKDTVLIISTPDLSALGTELEFCKTQVKSVDLNTLGATPTGGSWAASKGVVFSSSNIIDVENTPWTTTEGKTAYKLTYNNFGCTSSINLTVTGAVAPQDFVKCTNEGQFTLSSSPSGGKWAVINNGGNGGLLDDTKGSIDPTGLLGKRIEYVYTHTSCPDTIEVFYDCPLVPTLPTVNAGIDKETCAGVEAILKGTASNATSVKWQKISGSGDIETDVNLVTTYLPSAADVLAKTVSLSLTATNAAGSKSDTVVLTIIKADTAKINTSSNSINVCGTNQIELEGSGNTGTWEFASPNLGAIITSPNNVNTSVTNLPYNNTLKVNWIVFNSCAGSHDIATVELQAKVKPTVIMKDSLLIFENECDRLAIQTTPSTGVSFEWSDDIGINSGKASNTPEFCPPVGLLYKLKVTADNGCFEFDSVQVIVKSTKVNIISGFSPNGDGVNEVWYIENIERYPNNNVKVFNRWGNVVFEQKHYNNEWTGALYGSELPDATYYYVVDLGDNSPVLTGTVTIIR